MEKAFLDILRGKKILSMLVIPQYVDPGREFGSEG